MTAHPQDLGLIPAPQHIIRLPGDLRLDHRITVRLPDELAGARAMLIDLVARRLGLTLVPAADAGAHLRFTHDPALGEEEYGLTVGDHVDVWAGGTSGAIYALRTLQQLAGPAAFRAAPLGGPVSLPRVDVHDWPRFAHRGVLLDVARHFMPKAAVMRFIDLASAHKLSVLHLHLTDDQGWRMEIEAFPRLTQVGAWRTESQVGSSRSTRYDGNPHGGYYTQDDLREIVSFAHTRGMQVTPEIDVPGHSQAAMAAYPELATGGLRHEVWTRWGLSPHTLGVGAQVIDFYREVLDEVADVFDSPVICLGGDEVPAEQWAADPASMARVAQLGLGSADDLLPWFVSQLAAHLRTLGRRASVWDEVGGARVPRDVIVNSWRGYRGGLDALRDGHDIVICPEHQVFLDHRAATGLAEPAPVGTVHTLRDVYEFEPETDQVAQAAAEDEAGSVRGAQAQVWTEQLDSPRRVDYAAYPRLVAFAEVVWSNRADRSWEGFSARLTGSHLARLDAAGVEYRPLDGPHPWQQRPGVPGWPLRFDDLGNLVHAPGGER